MAEKKPVGRPEEIEIDLTTLGGRVRDARKRKKKKLQETAAAAHIRHPSLIDIEKGRTTPTERTLVLLAEFLEEDFGEGWLREHLKKKRSAKRRRDVTAITDSPTELLLTDRDEIELITFYRTRLPAERVRLKVAIGMLEDAADSDALLEAGRQRQRAS